jgi:hypothetical protein
MYGAAELEDFRARFLQDDVLAPFAPHLTLAHQWSALDRVTAEFAVANQGAIMAGVQAIMGRCQQQGGTARVVLGLAPDEYWLTVLSYLWQQEKQQAWTSVSNVGTWVGYPPNHELAARLHLGEVHVLPGVSKDHCAAGWSSTAKATHWDDRHPVTWRARQQPLLWVVEQARVVCGNLEALLNELRRSNDAAFGAKGGRREHVFVLRKVGRMMRPDAEWFCGIIRQRLGAKGLLGA